MVQGILFERESEYVFEGLPTGSMYGRAAADFLEEYNKIVWRDYDANSNLCILSLDEVTEEIGGSNPFAVTLANQILRPHGIRTATITDVPRCPRSVSMFYIDTALGLIGEDKEPSSTLSHLYSQARERIDFDTPVVIPYNGFDLVNADNKYGLSLNLRDDAILLHDDTTDQNPEGSSIQRYIHGSPPNGKGLSSSPKGRITVFNAD